MTILGPTTRARRKARKLRWGLPSRPARHNIRRWLLPLGMTTARAARIARWLTAQGIPEPTGAPWTAHTVYRALRGARSPRHRWPGIPDLAG